MAGTEVKVPDIGDFKSVEVIEVLVKPGDTVAKEQSLITLESDKATMEIPSPDAGKVASIKVKVGDKVSQGSTILTLEGSAEKVAPPREEKPQSPTAAISGDLECDVVVLGAGVGGYSAAFRAADLGMKVVLVERYATLGGVCLNVGCIPSKALLHVAAVMDEVSHFESLGVSYGKPTLDLDKLRAHKGKVVGKLTGGLSAMAKMRKVTVVRGLGQFVDPHHVEIEETAGTGSETSGKKQTISFRNCIIAAGSQAVQLPFMPRDERVVDSTGAL